MSLLTAFLMGGSDLHDMADPSSRLEKSGKLHYDMLSIHDKIYYKDLILHNFNIDSEDVRTEASILRTLAQLSSWKQAINIMLDKYQS